MNKSMMVLALAAVGAAYYFYSPSEQVAEAPIAVESSMDNNTLPNHVDCDVRDEWLYADYDLVVAKKDIKDIPTDFFLLSYSNSPRFCEHMEGEGRLVELPFQCSSPNEFGWVLHGLWAEDEQAYVKGDKYGHPQYCAGNLDKLRLEVIKPYLCMSPGTKLLQREWEKHGACDFETAEQYFAKSLELYSSFKLPPVEHGSKQAADWMKQNNPELASLRLDVRDHEFGICFTTEFELMDCPKKVAK